MSFLLSVVGVVLIVEGMPWFLSPGGIKNFLIRVHAVPNATLRFFGLTAMIVGLLIVRASV